MKDIRIPIILDKQFDCPYQEPFGYIYKITNKINDNYYIGQHEFHYPWLDKSYKGSGEALWRAYKKHGIENFETTILCWISTNKQALDKSEIYWIDMFKSYTLSNHYNLTPGGDGFGSGQNNPMTGKHKSEEFKVYMHNLFKDREFSEEHRQKLRESQLGNKFSKDSKQKMRDSKPKKSVVQLSLDGSLIRIYEAMIDVEDYGFQRPNVGNCCRGVTKTHKGFKWQYYTDYMRQK